MGDITHLKANTNINTNNDTDNDTHTNTYISKIYFYLEYLYNYLVDILVIKDNNINDSDSDSYSVLTQTKKFILKYRRIIGIVLLIGLLYIDYKCDTINIYSKPINKIGINKIGINKIGINKIGINKIGTMKGGNKLPMSGGAAGASGASKAVAGASKAVAGASKAAAGAQGLTNANNTNNVNLKDKGVGHYIYKRSAETGEKFKDFSGWLYQLLFSIAITFAICMIILPSLTFIIISVICFFLLKTKMASFKSL